MKKSLPIVGIGMILMTIVLSGCQEEGTTVEKTFENIFFDSEILELVEGSFNLTEDKNGLIVNAEVILYFKNLLDKTINVKFVVDFCDKDDNVVHNASKKIISFPGGWVERSPNIFSYNGENVDDVDHVNVRIVEYEIIE